MAKHPPADAPQTARIIHYVDPSTVAVLGPAQLAARERRERLLYHRWAERQHVIAERDRRIRRFWLVVAMLAMLVAAGWMLRVGLEIGAIAVLFMITVGACGRRCATSAAS